MTTTSATTLVRTALLAILLLLAPSATAQDDASTDSAANPTARLFELTPRSALGDPESDTEKAAIVFTEVGAGIASLQLPDAYTSVENQSHITLQESLEQDEAGAAVIPFGAISITVDGEPVYLTGIGQTTEDGAPATRWREISPGVFEAFVDEADGSPMLRIERAFATNGTERYGFVITNTVENLTDRPITVRFTQSGPVDLTKAENNYAGDKRRVRYGYLLNAERQAGNLGVTVDDDLASRTELLGDRETTTQGKQYPAYGPVWPNARAIEQGNRLSWFAFADRYFAVIVHPILDPAVDTDSGDRLLGAVETIDRAVRNPFAKGPDTIALTVMHSPEVTIEGGSSYEQEFGVYAGPMSRDKIKLDKGLIALNVPNELVVYNLGGWCAPCTFEWLTEALMSVLRVFHTISGDWAVSIILLVFLVRGCLHPITRWSQIRMQKFSAQMQAVQPKIAKLKEKYGDDRAKMQQEQTKLWREEGISPAGCLGMLPMFLQTPVWMALYAMLFFAVELRQEPAFYGIFQTISGGKWQFLNDLSQADHAIPLPEFMHFSFPLWGAVQAINLLPLMLGFVMYAHQKFLTPPTQATLTPEQESQQKLIKVMMVVMFPLMMYAAPSGLALYFATNSILGIAEHKWIRHHMNKHGMLDIEKIRAEKKTKGPGFMQRMTEAAEARRQIQERAQGGRPAVTPPKKNKKK